MKMFQKSNKDQKPEIQKVFEEDKIMNEVP